MVNINKELVKQFVNETMCYKYRINKIHDVMLAYKRFLDEYIHVDSKHKEIAKLNGFIDIKVIIPTWDGWRIDYNRNDLFNYADDRKRTYFSYELFTAWKRKRNLKELIE